MHRVGVSQQRAVLAIESAVLKRARELREIAVVAECQFAVFERAAVGNLAIVSVEEPSFDVGPVSREFEPERNLNAVEIDRRVPESGYGLRPGGGSQQ